jgi:hypothetical protein
MMMLNVKEDARKRTPWRRSRLLRYSLRALFALTLAAALPLWWLRVQLDHLTAEGEAIARLREAGVAVITRPPDLPWSLRLLPKVLWHDAQQAEIVFIEGPELAPAQYALLGRLAALTIWGNGLTDDGLRQLAPCRSLVNLNIQGGNVSDDGLA